jgi:glycosyltransferase involved in cell wall biosynthesis
MGAQVYEEAVAARAPRALGSDWQVDRLVARSLRSDLPGTHRLPLSRLGRAPAVVRRALGRVLYPRDAVVHRMGLELPPAAHRDVITLHDVIAWKFADESAPVAAAAEEARGAAAVICVSRFTAEEAVDLLGIEDPVVIPNGVDDRFFDALPLDAAARTRLGIHGEYVLASGGASARKNLAGLAGAWRLVAAARPDLTLVLSGPEHPTRTSLFHDLPRVRMVGRIDEALVPGLMAAASVLVVPSLYEGFGLPALEGLAVRTPVVAAETSSLPEVVGDAGTLVAPTPEGLADGVLHAASGHVDVLAAVERGAARARKFSWERCAAEHAEVWRRVAALS